MGEKTAKIIAKEYPTMDKLMNATYDELRNINITDRKQRNQHNREVKSTKRK